MKGFLSLLCVVCLSCTGCQVFRPPRMVPQAVYTVEPGDTLGYVSGRYDVSIKELRALNQLEEASAIYPGQKLRLPKKYLEQKSEDRSPEITNELLGEAQRYVGMLTWPIKVSRSNEKQGKINSQFGERWSSFHEGLDLAGPVGTPVYASHDGKVIYSGQRMSGYGNMVVVQGDKFLTAYAHNRRNFVRAGAIVQRGQKIAELGMTGRVTGPHLHFETRIKNSKGKYVAVNPLLFFNSVGRS